MAEVYAGERDDGAFEQRVAVKVLRRGLDTDDLLARFLRERRILARLEHPSIARLHDGGALDDGRPYLVMERVDGEPITAWAEARSLPIEDRLRLLLVACDAVAHAHRNLIVHRDLKPSNVLVTDAGELKLLDFGIAQLLGGDAEPDRTAREARLLTPAYASPEQLAGESTTTATDVWGLGTLAFELLVGEPPFAGPAGARVADAGGARREPPLASARRLARESGGGAEARARAARLRGDLDTILRKALAVEPGARYGSVDALADDLRRHLAGRPVRARPASIGYRAAKFARRHRAGLAAAALVAASLSIGGGVALWQARIAERERSRPLPAARHLTFSGADANPAASPDGASVAFRSLRDGRPGIWVASTATGDEISRTEGDDDHPRFSPDGAEILFVRAKGPRTALWTVDADGGPARRLVDDARFGDYSPDGGRIAFVRPIAGPRGVSSALVVAGRDGRGERELARFDGRALLPPRWSPDGRRIAASRTTLEVGRATELVLVDVESGASTAVPLRGSAPLGLSWAGPRRLVYSQPDSVVGWITGGRSRIVVHDLDLGAARTVLSSPTSISTVDVAAPRRLVFTTGSFRVNLQEIDLGAGADARSGARWLTRGDGSDRQPTYSPDGEWIVFSSNRGGNLDLWRRSRRTGEVRRLTDDPALDWDPAFAPDGDLLWSSNRGGRFEIWRAAADGSGARPISRDGVDAENPGLTADGAWLVYLSGNPASRGIVRARADGSEPERIVAGNVFLPELSPDGRSVAFVDLGGERPFLRVARIADGGLVGEAFPLPVFDQAGDPDLGRCRWFPDGRSLALLTRGPDGAFVVWRQPVETEPGGAPGRTGAPAAGRLLALEPGFAAESLGISPDGSFLTVAYWDRSSNLMLADDVWALAP